MWSSYLASFDCKHGSLDLSYNQSRSLYGEFDKFHKS